jgi:hypothetical protein
MNKIPLSDIFTVSYGNKFDLNKMTLLPRNEGGITSSADSAKITELAQRFSE